MKKLSPAKQEKLDRVHKRDCPAKRALELGLCLKCMEIEVRASKSNEASHY